MKKIKRGYGLNHDGYIVSDVSKQCISSHYEGCIEDSVQRLSKQFKEQVHSIYVYGSVARGDATPVTSDLDLIVVFTRALTEKENEHLRKLEKQLSDDYKQLVRDIGFSLAQYDEVMDPSTYEEQAFIKEMSVNVYGDDLGDHFGPYALTPQLAIRFNGDIGASLQRVKNRLHTASKQELPRIVHSFSKKLIRTYYSMVKARSQIWTTKLHEQAEVVITYFPEKQSTLDTLLQWVDTPPQNIDEVRQFFITEGEWLQEHFHEEASKY
ncbi:nucleotidyltransferase domain-containing protein [Geomicrobium sp. JCM 19039]|uniref:nucleotidyltransferase domain-containing protein n=1 Tax=Geomicrobium sp. JCM 19039 TaxID=1460636 RepID=UPI00045F2257|nr:nucleotidyltransferase domain-containing protein [Geomicrobium sp. JCM 19039]GAK10440.1 hypothetical protein JCM19039_52 [Geomicrobium sp. JCM 19039]